MSQAPERNDTARTEAFSDGVFAIATTLLVLDLHVPAANLLHGRSLADALGDEWPSLFAYCVSFLVIGIMWVNHHALFTLLRRVNRRLLFTNMVLLLIVALVPFPTALVAEYIRVGGASSHVAAAVYSVTMLLAGLGFAAVWAVATAANDPLVTGFSRQEVHRARVRFGLGTMVYVVTIGLAFVSASLTLAVHAAVAIYYAQDQLTAELGVTEPEASDSGPF